MSGSRAAPERGRQSCFGGPLMAGRRGSPKAPPCCLPGCGQPLGGLLGVGRTQLLRARVGCCAATSEEGPQSGPQPARCLPTALPRSAHLLSVASCHTSVHFYILYLSQNVSGVLIEKWLTPVKSAKRGGLPQEAASKRSPRGSHTVPKPRPHRRQLGPESHHWEDPSPVLTSL